ncbi:MAG TPA: potassium channel protein [Terriglobales bacterium]|jgi:voltage-gated potassium channel|nr:potassium channel protein [Terriglobales bacterium]
MNIRRRLLYAILALSAITAVAVTGYRVLGGPSVTFLQSLYMAVITLAGVGYGEIIDTSNNPQLRIFNMFVVTVGVTITLYVFSVVTAFLVEGEISNLFWRRTMQKRIQELKDHFIVCGLGDTGRYAVEELHKTSTPFIVIESHEDNIARFKEHESGRYKEILYVIGDATEESVLDAAGLDRARGVISAVASDKDNLVITVMVRQKNPAVRIVARCADVKFADRMLRAGANTAVSPNAIGGLRLASEALRPHVTSFLDLMLREKSRTLRIDEIVIPGDSKWAGKNLEELKFRANFHLMPLAVKTTVGEHRHDFMVNPPDTLALQAGTVLIVMGDVEEIGRAREAARQAQHTQVAANS